MSEHRKAPRAPGKSFQEVLKEYVEASGREMPGYLFNDRSEWFGDGDIDVDRYVTREAHELEKEHIWKKVWQFACREEQIPEVGDSYVYDITDISILVVRVAADEIKAFYNVCLHQGRRLRECSGHNSVLRCPFHGFTWHLDGTLKGYPSEWDFPQIDKDKFSLAEINVGRWGGFVFINMDPDCDSLADFLGELPEHFEKFPLDDRYIGGHVCKVYRANWKIAQEAFMETYHNLVTHSQFGTYFGGVASDAVQYDAFGNFSRMMGQGSANIPLKWTPSREDRFAASPGLGHPEAVRRVNEEFLEQDETPELFEFELAKRREVLEEILGPEKAGELSELELFSGCFFTVFPNFHPWWSYDELCYRFKPYQDRHDMCTMETFLLRPFKGERPEPAETLHLGPDDSHLQAIDVIGPGVRIFDQDDYNIPEVQKGMHMLKLVGKGLTLGTYQATQLRHFHKLWDEWVKGESGGAGHTMEINVGE